MPNHSIFKQRNLVIAISGAISAMAGAQTALAQQPQIEEVVVTGIRGSLRQAMDVKRQSSGVVDAISAEDIGKFPDTNLAESMQRITGVSINRINGEGSEVTVRGFGSGFNLVTLNGRQLPATNIVGNNAGQSRSFDFSNLASEGVSGIQVYKTGRAAVQTGGVGATVNISTDRPLETGPRFSVAAKAMDDQGGDGVTGEYSGVASWVNEDNTFGISAFGSLQERSLSLRAMASDGGFSFFNYDPNADFFANATITNAPEIGALYALPNNISMIYSDIERERTNGMLTMQFAPSDRLTITADAMYTSTEWDGDGVVPGIWWSRTFTAVEFDGNPVIAYPAQMTEFISDETGKDLFFNNFMDANKDESSVFGVNFEFQARDDLNLQFDAAIMESSAGGNGPGGKNQWRANVAGATAGWQTGTYAKSGVPQATIAIVDGQGNGNGVFEAADVGTQTILTTDQQQEMDIDQFRFSGNWDFNENIDIDFGVGYMDTEMRQSTYNTLDFLGGWGVSGTGDIPEGMLSQTDLTSKFKDIDLTGVPGASGLVAQTTPAGNQPASANQLINLGTVTWQVDPRALAQAMSDGTRYPDFDVNDLSPNGIRNNVIEEDLLYGYVQATLDGQIGDMSTQTLIGLRWEQTDLTSNTNQTVPLELTWLSDNDFRSVFSDEEQTLNEDFSYNYLLPSLDFAIDLTDELKGRASFSQTIARPSYNFLFIETTIGNPNTPTYLGGIATGSKGNSQLEPLVSNNFDLSLEWYYGESSYVSVGYYNKAVDNFVGTAQVAQPLFGLRDATSGQAGTLSGRAVAALQARGFSVNEPDLFTMSAILANPADFPNGADEFDNSTLQETTILEKYDISPSANDPLLQFEVTQPINNQTANIDGFEFAVQHFFGDSGFGIQANATIVNGDIEYDVAGDPTVDQFALEGLSDSANLVLIYEQDSLSGRLAYNWRDSFLANTNRGNRMPSFTDEYQQLDANISYIFNDSVTVSLDAINITEESISAFGRTRNILWDQVEGDARYVLGVRYNF